MLIIVATALLVIVFPAALVAVAAADFCIAFALVLCCTQLSIFLSDTPW